MNNTRLFYYFSVLPSGDDFTHATIFGTGRLDVLAVKADESRLLYDSDKPKKGFLKDNSGYWFDFQYQIDKFNWLFSDELEEFDHDKALDIAEFIVFFYYGIDLIETFGKIRDEVYIKQFGYYSEDELDRFSYFNVSPLKHKVTANPFELEETDNGYEVTVKSLDESFYHSSGTGKIEIDGFFISDDRAEPQPCTWLIEFDKSGVISSLGVDPIPEVISETLEEVSNPGE
ncbi:MAG: hypothetical protein GY771_15475 [bacterium]|nr:hypothetical protein [bacterium]